jgi:hypothetical protein
VRRTVAWLSFWLILQGLAVTFGLWKGWQHDQKIRDDSRDTTARICVEEWQDYNEDLRTAPLVGTALIEYAQGNADPDDIRRFETIVAGLVEEEIREPECDLEAARAVLDQ